MANLTFPVVFILVFVCLVAESQSVFQNPFSLDLKLLLPRGGGSGSPFDTAASDHHRHRTTTSRTGIFNREKLDPSNTNVYQDSATKKLSANMEKKTSETKETMTSASPGSSNDDDGKIPDNSNVYVPAISSNTGNKKKSSETGLRSDTSNEHDVPLQGNNYPGKKKSHPAEDFVDEDDFLERRPPRRHSGGDPNGKRNRNSNPFSDDLIEDPSKTFDDLFKWKDLQDFFNSRIFN